MKRPNLTNLLLKLATDPDELKKFRASKEAAEAMMKAAELTAEQCAAVLNKDPHDLQLAVSAELNALEPPTSSRTPHRTIDMHLYLETCCIQGGGHHRDERKEHKP